MRKVWSDPKERVRHNSRKTRARRIERIGKEAEARRQRNVFLKHAYGITLEQYEAMLRACEGRCEICGREITQRWPHLDHDHQTKKVRGILCPRCNIVVGFVERDMDVLSRIFQYLQKA